MMFLLIAELGRTRRYLYASEESGAVTEAIYLRRYGYTVSVLRFTKG